MALIPGLHGASAFALYLIIIIIQAFVRRTLSASELILRLCTRPIIAQIVPNNLHGKLHLATVPSHFFNLRN